MPLAPRVEYCATEFLGEEITPNTLEEEVDKKVSLLYDFCILRSKSHRPRNDRREPTVRQMLMECGSAIRMDNALHPVLRGDCTLNELLKRKGYDVNA